MSDRVTCSRVDIPHHKCFQTQREWCDVLYPMEMPCQTLGFPHKILEFTAGPDRVQTWAVYPKKVKALDTETAGV